MVLNKKITAIVLTLLVLISGFGLVFYEKPYVFRLTIDYSMENSIYFFTLYNDNTLLCSKVEKKLKSKNVKSKLYFWDRYESHKKSLTEQELKQLINSIEDVEQSIKYEPTTMVTDSWHYTLYYKGQIYETDGIAMTNKALVDLCIKIEELSPIEVNLPYHL